MNKALLSILLALSLEAKPNVGDSMVSFELPNLYQMSNKVSDKSYKGKVVLVNLWASWCGGCKEEMPLFVKLQKEFDKNKFTILLSNIDSDANNAKEFLSKVDKDKTLTCLYDQEKKLPKAYKAIGMPSSYLIDKNGKIAYIFVGSLHDDKINDIKQKITLLLEK
ncbi:TlpA family protein disulfide reductase [Sulfurimonas sp.]